MQRPTGSPTLLHTYMLLNPPFWCPPQCSPGYWQAITSEPCFCKGAELHSLESELARLVRDKHPMWMHHNQWWVWLGRVLHPQACVRMCSRLSLVCVTGGLYVYLVWCGCIRPQYALWMRWHWREQRGVFLWNVVCMCMCALARSDSDSHPLPTPVDVCHTQSLAPCHYWHAHTAMGNVPLW